jgi:hypothetical protein
MAPKRAVGVLLFLIAAGMKTPFRLDCTPYPWD